MTRDGNLLSAMGIVMQVTHDDPRLPILVDLVRSFSRKAYGKAPEEYSSDFTEFWTLYPRKTAKGLAWASWQKVKPSIEAVKSALAWQTQSIDWRKDSGTYVPLPATYLNQHRWEDEASFVPTGRPLHRLK